MPNKQTLVVLLAALLSGCAADPAPPLSAPHELPTGSVTGFVHDEERRPVAGARVRSVAGDASTATDGSYAIEDVPVGPFEVRIEHDAFEPLTFAVEVRPGTVERRDVTLTARPVASPYQETFLFRGHYDCASEAVFLVGDCLAVYENVTGSPDPVTEEAYAFRVPVKPAWSTIQAELRWQMAAENQLEGMRLLLEHGNGSKTGHGTSVAQVEGDRSPLNLTIVRGEAHASAERYPGTATAARVADEGETLQLRGFPRGRLSEEAKATCATSVCLFGAGVGLDLDFEAVSVVTYGPSRS